MSEKKQKPILHEFMEAMAYSSDPEIRETQKQIRKAVEMNEKAGVDLTISFVPPGISIIIFVLSLIIVAAATSDFSEQAGFIILVVLLYVTYYFGLLAFRKMQVMKPMDILVNDELKDAYGAKDFATEDEIKNALK